MNAKGIWLLLLLILPDSLIASALPPGKVVWWGADIFVRAGEPVHTNGVVQVGKEVLDEVVAIAAKEGQLIMLKNDGTVVEFAGPVPRQGGEVVLSNVVSIAAQGSSFQATTKEGRVITWAGSDRFSDTILADSNYVAAAPCGRYEGGPVSGYLAVKRDGTLALVQFRADVDPITGLPVPETLSIFKETTDFGGRSVVNALALAGGSGHALVLTRDGVVDTLNVNVFDLYSGRPLVPGEPPSITAATRGGRPVTNVVALAGGDGDAVALKRDGTLTVWGFDRYGQAELPQGLSNVVAIAAGGHVALALRANGTVVAWGDNDYGQASVPPGLNNVVAIAATGSTSFALTLGDVPPGVFVYPHGRLEAMEREADLVFKGQMISSVTVSNNFFPHWAKTHATKFKLISVLKGNPATREPIFWHMTGGPGGWGGGAMPSWHSFETGQCYIVFAAGLDKPMYLFSPPPDATNRPNEFRQLYNDGVMRTLDARPARTSRVKEAHWVELGLLLNDTRPTNQFYAIEQLDRFSRAGRRDDAWTRSDDFKRNEVLNLLVPMITNPNEPVARRAIQCFATESNAVVRLAPFKDALVKAANESRFASCRLEAIRSLSGTSGEAVTNSLAQLLFGPNENLRVEAVRLLPRFPAEFADQALRERARDPSAHVRSVVADVIGDGKYAGLLAALVNLFADPVGKNPLIKPTTLDDLRAGRRWNNIGDVHTSAGYALVKFDVDHVAGILKTNLGDPGFHINFVSKLAEKDARPWLAELVNILEDRMKYVREWSKLPQNDSRRYSGPSGDQVLLGTYEKCWDDIRNYLLSLPRETLARGEMDRYLDLLEQTSSGTKHGAYCLYELYRAKDLKERLAGIHRQYDKTEGWWFEEYDRTH